jgi:hypothetical protein
MPGRRVVVQPGRCRNTRTIDIDAGSFHTEAWRAHIGAVDIDTQPAHVRTVDIDSRYADIGTVDADAGVTGHWRR